MYPDAGIGEFEIINDKNLPVFAHNLPEKRLRY